MLPLSIEVPFTEGLHASVNQEHLSDTHQTTQTDMSIISSYRPVSLSVRLKKNKVKCINLCYMQSHEMQNFT